MKKYILPIAVAVMINLLFIAAVFFTRGDSGAASSKRQPVVYVNLGKQLTQKKLNAARHVSDSQWLQEKYGKAINIKHFFVAGKNLKGYVVQLKSDPDSRSIIYSINNGEYYFMGTVIDKNGHNVSLANSHHYVRSDLNKVIYNEAQKLSGIVYGKKTAPQVTIIMDPNSNLFPGQWTGLLYDVSHGLFSIKWVLVNYLKPMGPNAAASILQSKNPIRALSYNAKHYDSQTQTGGYAQSAKLIPHTRKVLRGNWNFVQRFNLYELPVTILRSSHHYYVIKGVVMDETLEGLLSNN